MVSPIVGRHQLGRSSISPSGGSPDHQTAGARESPALPVTSRCHSREGTSRILVAPSPMRYLGLRWQSSRPRRSVASRTNGRRSGDKHPETRGRVFLVDWQARERQVSAANCAGAVTRFRGAAARSATLAQSRALRSTALATAFADRSKPACGPMRRPPPPRCTNRLSPIAARIASSVRAFTLPRAGARDPIPAMCRRGSWTRG